METFYLKIVSNVFFVFIFALMEEKRLEIIQLASAVFMRFGLKSVTMDDLCRELGMSKKTLYKYFDDKNTLIKNTFQFHLNNDRKKCTYFNEIGENAVDSLFQLSEYIIEQFSGINPAIFYDLKKYYPEAWRLMEDYKQTFIFEKIRENVKRGVKEGFYRKNMNEEIIAALYINSVNFLFDSNALTNKYKLSEIYTEVIRYQIRGIVNDKGIQYMKQKFNNEINE